MTGRTWYVEGPAEMNWKVLELSRIFRLAQATLKPIPPARAQSTRHMLYRHDAAVRYLPSKFPEKRLREGRGGETGRTARRVRRSKSQEACQCHGRLTEAPSN